MQPGFQCSSFLKKTEAERDSEAPSRSGPPFDARHGPNIPNINMLFVAPKLKRTKCSFWKSILGSWFNVRVGLAKFEPASYAEVLRQPIFNNPLILNTTGHPLGECGISERCAIANSGCTRMKDFWDPEGRAWKSFQALRMTYHATNKNNKKIIIASIPWNPTTYTNRFQVRDWISKIVSANHTALAWVYHIIGVTPTGFIRAANSQVITISREGYHPIKVLSQEKHGPSFRVAKELPSFTKPPLLWIFEFGFIDGLP